MCELGLVGTSTTDAHPTTFTAGNRGSVGQGHRGVTTVPSDHQSIGSGSMLKAASRQSGFLVAGVESVTENRPVSRRIRYPRSQP